jgi:hypothetical protein
MNAQLQLSAALDAELRRVSRFRRPPLDLFHEAIHQPAIDTAAQPIHIVSSDVMRAIERNSHPSRTRIDADRFAQYAGIHIHEKPGQKQPVLIFRHPYTADAYLRGEITEQELLSPLTSDI